MFQISSLEVYVNFKNVTMLTTFRLLTVISSCWRGFLLHCFIIVNSNVTENMFLY